MIRGGPYPVQKFINPLKKQEIEENKPPQKPTQADPSPSSIEKNRFSSKYFNNFENETGKIQQKSILISFNINIQYIETNAISNAKVGYQITQQNKDLSKKPQQQQKQKITKNYPLQTRISIVGTNNIPPPIVPNQPIMQPGNTNFKTFYNWNANSDYNYQIDTDANNENRKQQRPDIVEEACENAENEDVPQQSNSPNQAK